MAELVMKAKKVKPNVLKQWGQRQLEKVHKKKSVVIDQISGEVKHRCKTCRKVKSINEFRMRPTLNGHLLLIGRNCHYCKRSNWTSKKIKFLKEYSNGKCVCACCGENHIEFLSLDHIGGVATRKAIGHHGRLGVMMYKLLERQNYPHKDKLRVLCHNCNQATTWGRVCPHQKEAM